MKGWLSNALFKCVTMSSSLTYPGTVIHFYIRCNDDFWFDIDTCEENGNEIMLNITEYV